MKKVIKIELIAKYDFVEKYNSEMVSNTLIEYIIKEAKHIDKNDSLEINIISYLKNDYNIKEMLINAFKTELQRTINRHHFNDFFQIVLFLIGIIFLSLSSLFKSDVIWKEILLIGGSVPIWEMIELELYNEARGRKRRKILNKLINSEINIKNELSSTSLS